MSGIKPMNTAQRAHYSRVIKRVIAEKLGHKECPSWQTPKVQLGTTLFKL